jgi:hypothetical protein
MNIKTVDRRRSLFSVISYGILLLGVSFSAVMVTAYPDWYHHGDVESFIRWAALWNKGLREIYNTCPGCNYPILGIFSTAGVFKILHRLGIQNPIPAFRLLLAAVDGLNVLLIFFLLKKLSIKNAALWAGVAGLLVSSWAGGAVWGQIDGVSQFFIFLTLCWMVIFNLSKKMHIVVYLVGCSLLLACLLLTKQLIVFSFACLELCLTVNIFSGRKFLPAAGYWLLHLAFLAVFVFGWDLFLNVDGPYVSHLQLVWEARSETASYLSMNGFSIWIFLNRYMRSDSGVSLLAGSNSPLAAWLTPRTIGMALFFLLAAVLTISTVRSVRRRAAAGGGFLGREEILNFILYLGLVNLIFNVVLAGTHERYLFHCYPFLLLACLGLREFDRRFSALLVAFVLIGSNLYGWFVLRVLWGDISFQYTVHKNVAVFHIVLLAFLLIVTLAHQGFGKRLTGAGKFRPASANSLPGG